MKKIQLLFLFIFFTVFAGFNQVPQLWGTTIGNNVPPLNYGTIYKINGDGTGFQNVYVFDSIHGSRPLTGLLQLPNKKFYGTAQGGLHNKGVLYSFDPQTNIYTDLHDFDSAGGYGGQGRLIAASNGLIFGLTEVGGLHNDGVLYSFDPATNVYSKLYDFVDSTGGAPQACGLVQAANGKLYGTTGSGGAFGNGSGTAGGTIFSFDIATNTYSDLYDFPSSPYYEIYTNLIEVGTNRFYGIAERGGAFGYGILFCYDETNDTLITLYNYSAATGRNPYGGVSWINNGKFYGITHNGGLYNTGVLYSYDTLSATYTDIYDFNCLFSSSTWFDRCVPLSASDGNLYGTKENGINCNGEIYKYDPVTNVFTDIFDFVNPATDGKRPDGNLIEAAIGTGINEALILNQINIYPNPTSKELKINNYGLNILEIEIENVLGEKVYKLENRNLKFETKIDVSNFAPGIYFVKVATDRGGVVRKFIKQ